MKIMTVGQDVRARHGLTSSAPRGLIVTIGTRGVVTQVLDYPFAPQLYVAEFELAGRAPQTVTVLGISVRDIAPVNRADPVPQRALSTASWITPFSGTESMILWWHFRSAIRLRSRVTSGGCGAV